MSAGGRETVVAAALRLMLGDLDDELRDRYPDMFERVDALKATRPNRDPADCRWGYHGSEMYE